jgi:hypothetical protein
MNQHRGSILEDLHIPHRLDEVHDTGKELKAVHLLLEVAHALLSVKYRSRSLRSVSGVKLEHWSDDYKKLGSLRSCFYCCHCHRCIQ